MAKTPSSTVRLAFNAGEIAPRLDQRIDLEKANLSARRMENMTMHVHGGSKRRPGLKFVAQIKETFIDALLLETGDYLNLETGDQILLD